jgi:hypothetical protein
MIVFAVFIAIYIIVISLLKTKKIEEVYCRTLGIIVGLASFMVVVVSISADRGYKQGQIDALTNDIQYKLVTMPDSTKVWEKIGEKKNENF